jgi:hypothetical protein
MKASMKEARRKMKMKLTKGKSKKKKKKTTKRVTNKKKQQQKRKKKRLMTKERQKNGISGEWEHVGHSYYSHNWCSVH